MRKPSSTFCRLTAAAALVALALPQFAAAGAGKSHGRARQKSPAAAARSAKPFQSPALEIPQGTAKQPKLQRLSQPLSKRPWKNLGEVQRPQLPFDPSQFKQSPNSAGAARPRIPRPNPQMIDPQIDLGRIRFPGQIELPGGRFPPANNPGNDPGNDPGNNPGDPPNPGDGDAPGNDPGDNPGDVPPADDPGVVGVPFPIFWPLHPGGYRPAPYCPSYPIEQIMDTPIIETARVDLLLEDVQYAEAATLLVGPAYRVKFRNQGAEPVGKFRVALLAGMDGELGEDAPQAIVEVAGLAAGESRSLTIRLPLAAMRLVSATGRAAAFTHLFVAVDVDNAIAEVDKTNNVAILGRTLLEEAAR